MTGTPYELTATRRLILQGVASVALVGLLGAFELGPMIVVSLLGGALADRMDRRRVLAAAQVGAVVVAFPDLVTYDGGRAPSPHGSATPAHDAA